MARINGCQFPIGTVPLGIVVGVAHFLIRCQFLIGTVPRLVELPIYIDTDDSVNSL